MGTEPREEDIPIDASSLCWEVQQALLLSQALPDIWEGMNGSWLGKDYSGLTAIMDIYDMDSRQDTFEYLKIIEDELSRFYRQKQKEQESLAKAKRAR